MPYFMFSKISFSGYEEEVVRLIFHAPYNGRMSL
jgi:hypothetical protein